MKSIKFNNKKYIVIEKLNSLGPEDHYECRPYTRPGNKRSDKSIVFAIQPSGIVCKVVKIFNSDFEPSLNYIKKDPDSDFQFDKKDLHREVGPAKDNSEYWYNGKQFNSLKEIRAIIDGKI